MSDGADPAEWDLEKVYDEQISPLMSQIIGICKEHKLPILASFHFSNGGDKDGGCCTTSLPFKERGEFRYSRALRDIRNGPHSFMAMTIHGGGDGRS